MSRFTFTQTSLEDVVLVEPRVYADDRGFFFESWHEAEFAAAGLPIHYVQENHSRSAQGVLRGLHYQDMRAPMAKLVRCTAGRIFDVAVDLRVGSPTFGRWFGLELSALNKRQILVPEGFAHGLQALEDGSEIQYKQTAFYAPECEQIVSWDDPDLAIEWPLGAPSLSARDRKGMTLKAYLRAPAFVYRGSPS